MEAQQILVLLVRVQILIGLQIIECLITKEKYRNGQLQLPYGC